MIAKNFVKYPEALRFQREMFSNGYHNSPRIMRLMQCIFDWTPTAPDWWKEAKGRARDLARSVEKSINDFFQPKKGNHEHKQNLRTTTSSNASNLGRSLTIRRLATRNEKAARSHNERPQRGRARPSEC